MWERTVIGLRVNQWRAKGWVAFGRTFWWVGRELSLLALANLSNEESHAKPGKLARCRFCWDSGTGSSVTFPQVLHGDGIKALQRNFCFHPPQLDCTSACVASTTGPEFFISRPFAPYCNIHVTLQLLEYETSCDSYLLAYLPPRFDFTPRPFPSILNSEVDKAKLLPSRSTDHPTLV